MTKKIHVQVLRIVDVDPFSSGLPFVKLTSGTGEVKTSDSAVAEKDPSKYRFSNDSHDNTTLEFAAATNPVQLAVAIFSKDGSNGHISQYPGIGKITLFTDDQTGNDHEQTCPLYEDGDEMLEIGALIYKVSFIADRADAHDEQGGLTAEDFNNDSLQLSPREADFNADSLQLTPREEPNTATNASHIAEPIADDVADIFERTARQEQEDVAQYLEDDQSATLFELDSVGPSDELIITPVPHILPQHMHQPEQVQPSAPAQPRDWVQVGEGPDPALISTTIHDDLERTTQRCSKIVVRLHSVICSSGRKLDASAASAKLSVQPLPGRIVTLRSVPAKDEGGASAGPAGSGSVNTAFSFGLKTAQLGMGAGDVRSKTFREGACPRMVVEVSLNGAESYVGFAELYLPALVADYSGQLLSLPLVSAGRADGDQSASAITSTVLLEINPPDLVPAAPEEVPAATKVTKKGAAKSAAKSAPVVLQVPSCLTLDFSFHGLTGQELAEHPDLGSTATVEAFLTSSGCGETTSLSRCATRATSATALSIHKGFSFLSLRPSLDILQLRFRSGPFPEDEFGRICVPVAAFFSAGSEAALLNRPIALSAWRANPERGGAYQVCKWKVVADLQMKIEEMQSAPVVTGALGDLDGPASAEEFGEPFSPTQTGVPASSLTNSPTRTGNWVSSPARTGAGLDYTGGVSSAAAAPTTVKSAAGQLLGCVKGYFSARTSVDGTGNQEVDGLSQQNVFGKGYTLFTEVALLPEGLRRKTPQSAAAVLSTGDIGATVEWGKTFSMFVAFALQQRPVPVLQFTVSAERAPAGGKGAATKTVVATSVLDLSTLISSAESSLVSFLLPVNRAGLPPQTTLIENRADIAGWLLVGLQFRPAAPGADQKTDLDLLELSMQMQWRELAAFPTQYCLGLTADAGQLSTMGGGASTAATLKALQANPTKLSTSSTHIAVASLQFASQRAVADLFQGWAESDVVCSIKVGNDPSCSVEIVGHIEGDHVVWYKADALLRIVRESSISPVLYVYIAESTASGMGEVAAEASFTISRLQLDKGLPVNFLLPLRDKRGERCANLYLSVQTTTLGEADPSLTGSIGGTLLTNTFSAASAVQPVPLRVEFCEGNIAESDVDDRMEPFFECSLLLPEQEELMAGPSFSTKSRTGFLRLTDNLEYWGLDCTVHVPPASVASISAAASTMLASSRTRAAFDVAQLSNGACIMGVVCRDASKQGCPEIGWARIALPRQLVLQGKSVEQWITLTPPSGSGSPSQYSGGVPTSSGAAGKHSRMKLRISVDHKDYDAAYSPFGIGAVLVRALGVHDFRAGMNDDLVSARMAASMWPNGSPDAVADAKDDFVFSQLSAHPASYINEMAMFNQDNLVGSLPVSGGFGDVRMNVKTFTTNTAYSASFPIMAATTKCVEGGELPPVPVLNLNLSREKSPDLLVPGGTARPQKARLEPQLKVAAAFVPYVTGKLVLHCTKLEMVVPPAETVPAGAVLRSTDSPLAIRYLLGNNSSRFMFSRPFDPSATGANKPLSGPPSLSQAANVTFMEVDTFDVISNSIRRGENMSMMPLFVSLLEQWDLLDPVVERRGQQACVGMGYVPTAVCYYQALRAAASAPMEVRPDNNGVSQPLAASPWLSAVVDLFDPKTKLKVAVMSLNVQFVMTSVPEHVVRMLGSTLCKSPSDPAAKARTELGLKQSFVLADTDKSGAVSSEELLRVISQADRAAMRKKTLRGATATIGMENAVELLLQLANVQEGDIDRVDAQALGEIVRKIFMQLDVDGDGLVSWWEWKSVLTASILGHNPSSKFMYHLDALVIGMQGAYDALKTLAPNRKVQSLADQYAGLDASAVQAVLPYIKLKIQGFDPSTQEAIVCEDTDDLSVGSAPSKSVSRLHSMVKSLRLTNSILAKRFERALSTAQNLSINLDQDMIADAGAGASRQGAKLSEIETLEQRIHDSEHQTEQNMQSFLTAKERADQLMAQLLELQTTASVLQQSRSKPELFTFNADLEKEIEANAEKLKNAQMLRKQRTSEVFSLFRLRALVSKWIMPKIHKRRRDKAAAELARVLTGHAVRKNYLAEKEKRRKAALVLQGAGRGLLGRKRVKEMNEVATKTQCLFRAKLARRTVQNLKVEKAERERLERERQLELKRNLAACRITRTMRVFTEHLKAEKASAALKLQAILKKRLNFKAAKAVADGKRKEKDLRTAEERRLAEELAKLQEAERLRLEEERRRQEAALKLTRALTMKSGIMTGKKIHAFLAAQAALHPIARPDIHDVAGKWVSYPKSMSTVPRDAEEAQSSFRHFGRGNYGNVQSCDPRARIMHVLFLYNKVEGAGKKSGAKFEVEKLPYDHPLLEFFSNEAPVLPEVGYMVHYVLGGERHWLPFKPYTDRPDRIEDTLGYKVGVRDPETHGADMADAGEAIFPGRVVGFDRANETVLVLFDAGDPNLPPDQESILWTSLDIQWLMPAAVSRPATIQEAPGYNVEVNRAESATEAHRAVRGTVVSCNEGANTVRVVYAPVAGEAQAIEEENVDFESARISWLNKVPLDQLPSTPRPQPKPSGPSISKLIETTRPTDILATVGHLVEVKSTEEDAEPGDMYSGMVIAADSHAGTVRVLYDADKNRDPALVEEEEEDFEDIPWMSSDIVWVMQDPSVSRPQSALHRPKSLADAVGKQVDVLSREPDAVEGDYFCGRVISVDNAAQTIRVLFDGNGNGEDDFEDLPWNSPEVFWLTDESIHARDTRSVGGESVASARDLGSAKNSARDLGSAKNSARDLASPYNGSAKNSARDLASPYGGSAKHSPRGGLGVRPGTCSECVDWRVKVGADLLKGEVVAVEAAIQCLWVAFTSVPNALAPVQVKLHWKSPNIDWIPVAAASSSSRVLLGSPAAMVSPVQSQVSLSTKPTRPATLSAALGWAVEVRAEDAEDEVFVGEVGGVDEATQMVKVLFAGEDGTLEQDDAEFFPFDSKRIHWVEGPAKATSSAPAAAVIVTPVKASAPKASTPAEALEPATIEAAVGRSMNVVLDYLPGTVKSASNALQTVNILLDAQTGLSPEAATLLVGVPFTSSIIEWDCKL